MAPPTALHSAWCVSSEIPTANSIHFTRELNETTHSASNFSNRSPDSKFQWGRSICDSWKEATGELVCVCVVLLLVRCTYTCCVDNLNSPECCSNSWLLRQGVVGPPGLQVGEEGPAFGMGGNLHSRPTHTYRQTDRHMAICVT